MKDEKKQNECKCKGTGIIVIDGVEHSCPVCMEKKDNASKK